MLEFKVLAQPGLAAVYQMVFLLILAAARTRLVFLSAWIWVAICSLALAQPAPKLPPAQVVAPETQEATRLYRRGDLGPALERIENYLQRKPDDLNARFLRGVILSDQKRIPEALDVFTRITQDYPELAEVHNNLAVLYAEQGRYDRARYALEQAILASPNDETALENLGDVYTRLASQAYERVLTLAPRNRSARAKLTLLRELNNPRPQTRGAIGSTGSDTSNTIDSGEMK